MKIGFLFQTKFYMLMNVQYSPPFASEVETLLYVIQNSKLRDCLWICEYICLSTNMGMAQITSQSSQVVLRYLDTPKRFHPFLHHKAACAFKALSPILHIFCSFLHNCSVCSFIFCLFAFFSYMLIIILYYIGKSFVKSQLNIQFHCPIITYKFIKIQAFKFYFNYLNKFSIIYARQILSETKHVI